VSAIGLLSTVRGVAAIRPEGVKPTCHGSSIDAIDPERTILAGSAGSPCAP